MQDLPATGAVDLEPDGDWLTIWFNQPDIRNPLTGERVADLLALCAHLRARPDIRGVTFRGRGGIFCAGGDLKTFKDVFQGSADTAAVIKMSSDGGRMMGEVAALPQVTVMAIEGAAMAGGFGLACAGDIVIAEQGARFALTETMIGLAPAQIAPFVIERLGLREGRRLMMLAQALDGEEALRIGLADRLVDGAGDMDAAIADVRAQAMRCAPGAVAETKRLIRILPPLSRAEQVEAAAASFAERMLSDEGREGISSFFEKRKPHWAKG